MGDTGVSQGESLGHTDALERALQIIPRLHSTNELVIGLSAAILKDSSLEADRDPYTEWSFQDIFNEDGIVLDPVYGLPESPVGSSGHHLQSLQECSQLELALRLLVNSFSSGLQHVTSNNMDLALSSQLHDRSRLLRDRECVHEFGKTTLAAIKAVAIALLQKVSWPSLTAQGSSSPVALSQSVPVHWHGDGENDRCLIGEWWTVTWPLDTALSSQRKMCLKYCGKSSTTPGKTMIRSCTFDLDGDAALHLYITTLLKQQESDEDLGGDEGGMGDTGVSQGESLGHTDALERALQIIPRLHSTNELVIGLSTAILKLPSCTSVP
ncbi:hypothetical protein AAFF_G00298590 [Aldrovandia affinis]|uniref:KNTC1 third ARM-repeats domain-containing protein n=1 Tax=Aldrovandia affinis TaxID=143900 RepID=A0AAD7R972_9TELE|nr:hypothetical protein AAFF_G00298590 [Aldrovandia affinis]